MIDKVNSTSCYLCGACNNICPKNAITFSNEVEGFQYPTIDRKRCVGCNLCEMVCPALNPPSKRRNNAFPIGFAAQSKNIQIRKESTSGAVFYELGSYVIENGGYVCGAIFDKEFNVKHIITDNSSKLSEMRGSKYVQSETAYVYREIKELISKGNKILFCGCPCQVAALKRIVGKETENLITVDFVCHGIPSQEMFDSYRAELERRFKGKIYSFQFRNKDNGWHRSAVCVSFDNGNKYHNPTTIDPYYRAFLSGTMMKYACYHCGFKECKSGSDLTLGDFWGAEVLLNEWDDNTGISAVLVNSERGKELLDSSSEINKQEVEVSEIVRYNRNIIQPTAKNPKRDEFFIMAQKTGFGRAMFYFFGETRLAKLKRCARNTVRKLYYKISGRKEPLY